MCRGEIRWASLPIADGAGPGFLRPMLVVQSNEFNDSRIQTVICAVITPNTRLAKAPGNVLLSRKASGLKRESVANVSQLITIDRRILSDTVGRLPAPKLREADDGIRLALAI